MIIIEDRIYKTLKEYLSSNSEFNPIVVRKAPREQAKFPIVIVREIENNFNSRTVDGIESISSIVYSVEVYAKDTENYTKEQIARELGKLVDRVMSKKFNLIRTNCQELPNLDINVFRLGMRYNGLINDNRIRIY